MLENTNKQKHLKKIPKGNLKMNSNERHFDKVSNTKILLPFYFAFSDSLLIDLTTPFFTFHDCSSYYSVLLFYFSLPSIPNLTQILWETHQFFIQGLSQHSLSCGFRLSRINILASVNCSMHLSDERISIFVSIAAIIFFYAFSLIYPIFLFRDGYPTQPSISISPNVNFIPYKHSFFCSAELPPFLVIVTVFCPSIQCPPNVAITGFFNLCVCVSVIIFFSGTFLESF